MRWPVVTENELRSRKRDPIDPPTCNNDALFNCGATLINLWIEILVAVGLACRLVKPGNRPTH